MRHSQHGVGLVEILVAVLVLSIGLLGVATLQLHTLRNNQSSLERSAAITQSYSIADAMRADKIAATGGAFNITLAASAPTASDFATAALAQWRQNLVRDLGEGATGSVNCAGFTCTIVVQWNDQRGTGGASTQQLTTQVYL